MKRTLLKSKIHRATVTEADLNYEGSITIDRRLMDLLPVSMRLSDALSLQPRRGR